MPTIDSYLSFLTIALISFLGALSPGPDFFVVLKNSLSGSRKAGLWTVFGVSTALIVHLTYTLLGIGVLILESPFLYHLVKYVGIAYLFYIGIMSLIASFKPQEIAPLEVTSPTPHSISNSQAFTQGFFTNLLNPKAAFFFISLFSQFVDPSTPAIVKLEYAMINWVIAFCWFTTVCYLVTVEALLKRIQKFYIYVDRAMGCILIALGIKLMLI